MSDLKEHFFSSSAETGLFDVQLTAMRADSFLYEISVLVLLIPSPEVINLCLGHQNPSPQQLVLILKMLQVKKKKISERNIIPVGRHFSLDIKKREVDLFSLSCLFVRRKSTQEIPRAVTRDTCHHRSILQCKSPSGECRGDVGELQKNVVGEGCRTPVRNDRVDPFLCMF